MRRGRLAGDERLAAELPGASYVQADIADGPDARRLVETTVERHVLDFADAWDFEEVYGKLLDFARAYPFDPEAEDFDAAAALEEIKSFQPDSANAVGTVTVEDEETLAALQELGCDETQGYLHGRPMSSADFRAWMLRQKSAAGRRVPDQRLGGVP